MPIVVKLKQQMADGHKCQGQYFAKRVNTGTLDIDDLAQMVQDNVSVKKSDVKAVIEELIDVMKRQMQNGHTCKLNGFGSFYISTRSEHAPLEELKSGEKRLSDLIVGYKTNFREAVKNKIYPFRTGCSVREHDSYVSPRGEAAEEADDGEGDGD